MIPPVLAAALAAFDEGALTMLASKGLYRRAVRDLDEGKVALSALEADTAIVLVDGETVRIDKAGPATARCTCPAPGVCRHRIAAVLFLQASTTVEMASPPAPVDWQRELAGIGLDDLRRWTGKAAWQAALELAEGEAKVVAEGAALVIALTNDQPEVRLLAGQGLDGLLSKASPARRKALHAAAYLAARRHFGLPVPDAQQADAEAEAVQRSIDPAFLADVRAALGECVRSALNIAPLALEERLFTLSVSSRSDALPRLAALLRTIASRVRERRERTFTFDPDRCLALIAEADALARALGVPCDDARRAALNGSVRQDFAAIGPLTLTAMGADLWRTDAGARGVTGHFYDPATDRWFSASVARGAGQDPSFDPMHAYAHESLWGAGPLSVLAKASIGFEEAVASAAGRLSTAAAVRAAVITLHTNPQDWQTCFDDWEVLRDRLRQRLIGGLTARRPSMEPVILRPRRLAVPSFDDLSQSVRWPIEDLNGRWLELLLAHGRDRKALMESLELFEARGWSGSIVALATIGTRAFHLRPFALHDDNGVHNLGTEPLAPSLRAEGRSRTARLVGIAREALSRSPKTFLPIGRSQTTRLLDETWSSLMALAEVGRLTPSPGPAADLARLAARLSKVGLETVSQSIAAVGAAHGDGAGQVILAACYLVELARKQRMDVPRLLVAP